MLMKTNRTTLIIVLLILCALIPPHAFSQVGEVTSANTPTEASEALNPIDLVFDERSPDRITGSVENIDVEAELKRDSRSGVGSAINGKVPGVFDAFNIWGTGPAVIVVDGVRQDDLFYQNLNLREVESIVVLKDAASKALYGAQGDQGVVLINTKRGKAGAQKLRLTGEYSVSTPRALPEYLNAADYMTRYNEAQLNDGVDPLSVRYNSRLIDSTRNSTNRIAYPDNDFYTSEYLRSFTRNIDVFADLQGGGENARYYVNATWQRNDGWLSTDIPDQTDRFGFRSNLDFKINRYLSMAVDAVARVHFNERPNVGNYWNAFGTILPNQYPVLWDPSVIVSEEDRQMVLTEANLIDGKVLGGSSTYANNQIYGDLIQNGRTRYQQRHVQFGGRLNADLSFITEGLTASGYGGMNFYNSIFTQQNYEYAIYEPVLNPLTGAVESVVVHGVDVPSNRYVANPGQSDSFRQVSFNGNIGYDRTFGQHDISAAAVIYGDQIAYNGQLQKNTLFHTGLLANYMFRKRYVVEASAMAIGSRKLPEGERMEWAPSAGIGWILSEEDFMDNVQTIDYLKVRASYGISKNDNWSVGAADDYFLYSNMFRRGPGFAYYNGTHNNGSTLYASVSNSIHLQKREDILVGLDAEMLDRSVKLTGSVFRSTSLGNITAMASTYPSLLGVQQFVYSNYNSDKTEGVELGLSYTFKTANKFSATIGGNLLHIAPLITRRDEPEYEGADRALRREGTPTDAMRGLIADGLYSEADFENGELVTGLPVPTFGAVQPGDIKYLDQNNDGIIDQNDQRTIGHGVRTQYSAYIDVRYKNFGLYILGIGRLGGSAYRSGSYFRVFGDVKYSEYATQAYGPDNKDINAIHPRLSANSGGHNDRNSSFWTYENDRFTLPVVQLTYQLGGTDESSRLKPSQVYVRGSNILVLGKNKKFFEVNPAGAPGTRSIVVGLITSF